MDKGVAIQEFTYIEFVSSMKKSNPYSGYSEKEKRIKVSKGVIKIKGWKEDKLVREGIERLKVFQVKASPTYNYYISAKLGADKMQEFFKVFDIGSLNTKTGNPIYKPRDITSALNDTAKVLENLNSMREKVDQELFESTKVRGQKEISPFSMPDDKVI